MSAQQRPYKRFLEALRAQELSNQKAVTLVIGEISRWSMQGRTVPEVPDLTYVDFNELSSETVTTVEPDVIFSPLVTNAFDAFQVVRYLDSFGYCGRYRAVATHLPNLTMVREEIKAEAPAVDFDIVMMPPALVAVT
jgi:hypothetical protein